MPHGCGKLQSFALVLQQNERKGGDRYTERERETLPEKHRTNPQPHRKQLQRNPRQRPPDPFKTFTLKVPKRYNSPRQTKNPHSSQKNKAKIAKDASRLLQRPSPPKCKSSPPPTNISCRTTHSFCAKSLQRNFRIDPTSKKNQPTFRVSTESDK